MARLRASKAAQNLPRYPRNRKRARAEVLVARWALRDAEEDLGDAESVEALRAGPEFTGWVATWAERKELETHMERLRSEKTAVSIVTSSSEKSVSASASAFLSLVRFPCWDFSARVFSSTPLS